jgi:uncharacterized protein
MKMRFLILATFLSAVASVPGFSQEYYEPQNTAGRRITTSGSAEVRVVPSKVVLTFGVETFNPDLAIAKRENDTKAGAVIALAKELGVDPKDVQTDYIFVEPIYEGYDDKRKTKFLHYLVRKTVAVLLRDVSKFENLLSGALERGATHVLRVRFEVDKLKEHRDKARADAVSAARDKAQLLVRGLGAKLGRVMYIQEYSYYDPTLYYGGSWRERYEGGGQSQVSSQAEAPVSPTVGDTLALGQMRVSAQINVVFELL